MGIAGAVLGAWASLYVAGTVMSVRAQAQTASCAPIPNDRFPAILSFVGAIAVAVIGAAVAWRRQDPPPRRRSRQRPRKKTPPHET